MNVLEGPSPTACAGRGSKNALLILGVLRLSEIGDVEEGQLMQRANLGNI